MPYYLVSRFIYLDKKRVCEQGSFAEACIHEGYEPFTEEFRLARNRKKNHWWYNNDPEYRRKENERRIKFSKRQRNSKDFIKRYRAYQRDWYERNKEVHKSNSCKNRRIRDPWVGHQELFESYKRGDIEGTEFIRRIERMFNESNQRAQRSKDGLGE